jgi:hemerythrin
MLMNFPVLVLSAGLILIKKGTVNRYVYLILNGVVDIIDSDSGLHNSLSAGSLLGDLSAMAGEASRSTYRSASSIRVLRIPSDLFIDFMKRNDVYEELEQHQERRIFLRETRLFGEMISCTILNRIAREMKSQKLSAGKGLEIDEKPSLYMIETGEIEIISEKRSIETIGRAGYFGEERILYGTHSLFEAVARKKSNIFTVPGDALDRIPIIQLKLQETLEKRVRILESTFVFEWREDYSVGVDEMDEQHKTLFEKVRDLYRAYHHHYKEEALEKRVAGVIDYVKFHLKQEEELLKNSGYPGYTAQRDEHDKLKKTIAEFLKDDVQKMDENRLLYFFKTAKAWLLRHTILEDMKYKKYFTEK